MTKKVITPSQAENKEAFEAAMLDPNVTLTLDSPSPICAQPRCKEQVVEGHFYCKKHTTITTKEESTMTNTVKEKTMNMKEKASELTNKVKDASIWAKVARTFKTAYTWTKDKVVSPSLSFLNGKKIQIAVGSAAVTAGGIVTTSASAAVAVGAGVAALVVVAAHLMQKKKEQKLQWKAMLVDMGVTTGTAIALPFMLLGLAYAGVFATVYGALLPYAIIVA